MSTLTDAVIARYSTERLSQLTQKDNRSPTTVNTTVLGLAAADAVAEFQTRAGVTFDDTNAQHIRLCCGGTVAFLVSYKGQDPDAWKLVKDFQRDCDALRMTGANKRIQPITTRDLGPSPDIDGAGRPRRPEFDRPRFDRLNVNPPHGGTGRGS